MDNVARAHDGPARSNVRPVSTAVTSLQEKGTSEMSNKTTDLVPAAKGMDVASLNELDEILRTGEMNAEVIDDPDSISRSIIDQLLGADSDEALQDFGNAQGWRELLEVPIELHGFRWRVSDYAEGAPIYFIVSGTRLDTGDRVTLTTGSLNVLAQLSNMARRGTLVGGVWQLHEAEKQTRAGFKPLWLVQPDAVREAARASKADADAPAAS